VTAIIRIDSIVNRFGTQVVHDGVSLDVQQGEVFGIVGGSGSGKSVLLKTMLGLHRPNSGRVEVEGLDITTLDEARMRAVKQRYGVTFQQGALFSSLTVADNIVLPVREAADRGYTNVVNKGCEVRAPSARARQCDRVQPIDCDREDGGRVAGVHGACWLELADRHTVDLHEQDLGTELPVGPLRCAESDDVLARTQRYGLRRSTSPQLQEQRLHAFGGRRIAGRESVVVARDTSVA